jgi:acyl-CoA thioesterase-2
MGDLAVDTAVEQVDEGRYRATLDDDWRIWGPNGGYLGVIALRAAGAASTQPRPASIAVHFLGVAAFEPVDLEVTTLRTTRRAQSLRVSMTQGGKAIVEALVWAVADGIEPLDHAHAVMPDVPAPETVPTMEQRMADAGLDGPPFPFWVNIDNRGLQWRPDWPPPGPLPPEARWWCRYRPTATFDDRWVDAGRAFLLVDTFGWPAASAAHAWRNESREKQLFMAPSIDVHCTFHAFEPDAEWLLVDAYSPVGGDGLLGSHMSVWTESGRLVASGNETMLVTPIPG